MPNLENLTERDIDCIVTAVEAVAALPSGSLPGDIARGEEWKALAEKLKAQRDLAQKRSPSKSRYGWSSDPVTDAELQAKYGDSVHRPKD